MRWLPGGKRSASASPQSGRPAQHLFGLPLVFALCILLSAVFSLTLPTEPAGSTTAQQLGSAAAMDAASPSPARLSPVVQALLEGNPAGEGQYVRQDGSGPNCTNPAECGRPANPGHPTWTPCTPQPSRNCPPKKGGGGGGGGGGGDGGGSGGGGGHGVRRRSGQDLAVTMTSVDAMEVHEKGAETSI